MITLKTTTSDDWTGAVLDDLPTFLADHALCERKASAMARSLIRRSPDHPAIHAILESLAVEEADHYRQVLERIDERGFPRPVERKDAYVGLLRKLVRTGRPEDSLTDLLLVAAIIEARSLERLKLAAKALEPVDSALAGWYRNLARAEARHAEVFVQMATRIADADSIHKRLDDLLTEEARIVDNLPVTAHVH